VHWSEGHGKQKAMNELLIDAYFKRGLDISNTQILLDLAEQLGMDRSLAEEALSSSEVTQALTVKKSHVKNLGLSSIPAFILNTDTLITGSNSVEYFENIIIGMTK